MAGLAIDGIFGVIIYIIMTIIFGKEIGATNFGLAIFFAYAPDIDFIPFIVLRKRLRLVSHRLIHFPLLYIPTGVIAILVAGGEVFHATTFVLASTAHFVHDTTSAQGMQLFYPISRRAYALEKLWFVHVTEEERQRFYNRLREGASQRSIIEEFMMRIRKDRPKWFSHNKK